MLTRYYAAIDQTKAATPAERIATWRRLAGEIEASQPGREMGWKGTQSIPLADGGTAFVGSKGPALVFDPQGNMYRGAITNPEQLRMQAQGMSANYSKMQKL